MSETTSLRWLAAGVYAAIGAVAILDPHRVLAVFGGSAATPESRIEVRAVYGGIPIAFAVALAPLGGRGIAEDAGMLRAVRDASAGMALARLAGAAVERRLRLWPTAGFAVLEVGLAAAAHRAGRRVAPGSDGDEGTAPAG